MLTTLPIPPCRRFPDGTGGSPAQFLRHTPSSSAGFVSLTDDLFRQPMSRERQNIADCTCSASGRRTGLHQLIRQNIPVKTFITRKPAFSSPRALTQCPARFACAGSFPAYRAHIATIAGSRLLT